jgi:cytochrome P450
VHVSTQPAPAAAQPGLKNPAGPRGHPVFGVMFDFQRDPLAFLTRTARDYGDVAAYRMAQVRAYQVSHPEAVQRVLQENNRNYIKGVLFEPIRDLSQGSGLFVSEGEYWLRQRRLMQPVFHRQHVAGFGGLMTSAAQSMLAGWGPCADSGRPLDVFAEMTGLTMKVAAQALFTASVGADSEAIGRAVTTIMATIEHRYEVPFYPPLAVPTPRNLRHRAALRLLDRIVYDIIRERRQRPLPEGAPADLLSLLMDARDPDTGEAMTDKQLRDEVLTLFVAGHETTSNALTWAWHLLSQHPEAESRLHAEVDEALGGRVPTVADLPRLPYARLIIDETMRLYPPAWITNRQAVADDQVRGYRIPAGAVMFISPYVTHRLPEFWPDPEAFDPERFTPERSAGRPHFAYFPFGGGPHQCIGKGFALVEAHLVLATVAQHYRLRAAPGHPARPLALVTLRPRGGMPMILERRAG